MANNKELKRIEVFRAGDYGAKGAWDEADLDAMVQDYSKSNHEAPLTIDHKQEGPAYGWVSKIYRAGASLFADARDVSAPFFELVKAKAFNKRSAEIYKGFKATGRPYLKAVTFLGAGVPEVKGMADLAFSADAGEYDSYEFAEGDTEPMDTDGFPSEAFAFVGDAQDSNTWQVRLWETPEKKITRGALGRAVAAFSPGGLDKKRVKIPAGEIAKVKAKVRAAFRSIGTDDDKIPKWVKAKEPVQQTLIFEAPSKAGLSEDGKFYFSDEVFDAFDFGATTGNPLLASVIPDQKIGDATAAIVEEVISETQNKVPIWLETATADDIANVRSDLFEEIQTSAQMELETSHTEEITLMSEKETDLQTELEAKNAQIAQLSEERDELNAKWEKAQQEKARAEASKILEAALAKAGEFSELADLKPEQTEKVVDRVRQQFTDSEDTKGISEAATAALKSEADYIGVFSDRAVTGMGTSVAVDDQTNLNARAEAYATEHKVSYSDALLELSRKTKTQ